MKAGKCDHREDRTVVLGERVYLNEYMEQTESLKIFPITLADTDFHIC